MNDIILCTLPYSNLDHIYSAPAILKGVLQNHGFKVTTIDFGCELSKLCNNDTDLFYRVQNYFINPGNLKNPDEQYIIDSFYESVIDFFKKTPSLYIGFSIFSIYTHKSVVEILDKIKEEKISSKIIVGGRGSSVPVYKEVFTTGFPQNLTKIEEMLPIGEVLKKRNLTDYHIVGDGEEAIVDLLTNGTQFCQQTDVSDLFKSPVPDYTDYNFQDYLFANNEVILPVTGSKGCVRDCDFCDVKLLFGKYRYRSGRDIANEIISLSQKYNIKKFQFTDSLVNGSLKIFREFVQVLSDYNINNPDQAVAWNGQYICRVPEQMPQDLYKLMAQSGAHGLTIGAESGSNAVLTAMNKKTTVEALYAELEQFRKYNITCTILTFVGHWSETWENFVEHCKMFVNLTPYVRSGTISTIQLGLPMAMLHGTPAVENAEKNQVVLSSFAPAYVWKVKNNPGNTFKERAYRRLLLVELLHKLKIPTIANLETFATIIGMIEQYEKDINEFYEKCD